MVNFTGQSRKRVVNLGDNRMTHMGGNRTYLEKTKLQRQQREEQRLREKAAVTLKQYVLRYLSHRKAAEAYYEKWLTTSIGSQSQFDDWIIGLNYFCVWKFPFDSNESIITPLLETVYKRVDEWKLCRVTSQSSVEGLLQLIEVLRTSHSQQLVHRTCQCIEHILKKSPTDARYPGFIDTLTSVVDVDDELVTSLIFRVNMKDSYFALLKFLARLRTLSSSYLDLLRKALSDHESTSAIGDLSKMERIDLLVVFLSAHTSPTYVLEDFVAIDHILSQVSFSVYCDESAMDYDKDGEDVERKDMLRIGVEAHQLLRTLYSGDFIKTMMDFMSKKDHDVYVINIVSSLAFLIPDQKPRLLMFMTINHYRYSWFYKRLTSTFLYKQLVSVAESKGKEYWTYTDFKTLYEQEPTPEFFWRLLFTFTEMFSYWLIISNDFESFSDDGITTENAASFVVFLKRLCLTMIFNSNQTHSTQICHDFYKVKDASIVLLNQLYLKNLRLKFMDESVWSLKKYEFRLESVLHLISDDDDEVSSDSDNNDIQVPGKDRQRSEISAKLEILKKLPFFLNFKERVQIFQRLIDQDKPKNGADMPEFFFGSPTRSTQVNARREHLLEDGFKYLGQSGPQLKHGIQVTFFNEYGQEAGVDGGGITKEFLSGVVLEGFDPNGQRRLFKETSEHQLYPNDEIFTKYYNKIDFEQQLEQLQYLRFLGNIVGKCLYDQVLIDVSFAPFFLNKWCNAKNMMKNSINDLNYLDPELFKNLVKFTKMSGPDIEDLDLNFTVNTRADGKQFKFDLVKNGEAIKVTAANRSNYIHQMANFLLNTSLHIQSKHFLQGVFAVVNSNWLKMFDFNELQMLISGSKAKLDIANWKQNVEYGGYLESESTIQYFWQVVEEMTSEEQSKLVKFVTSVSRAPLLGFQSLNPKFGIRNSGRSTDRLPTAATCVNLLKLPDYQDKEVLRQKLIYAINVDAGFDLS
ncbi:ubiquitin-protein ligase (E3) [Yamadazyma tenuis]|uniref:HECT-type E3 ubiquitin transferase n=1 Tax=Candida tenuis (strain ATCC 10573 / BCRC 21748 / CBS 615 / JCM 9827 / NBRC 10315 / NRRL Y-1498 / VKM Y-70) TaxID=590646 RepID=G3AZU7_CANTC|nr:uncharacterized protein CANTEDRAFT_97178 [Yamadazyma tenuis ATCC 10573]EGV65243.1 hypothetical protein CANTEDRAFT_97178 [Yamadazyma tenuis ATCC 10573]WEJ95103.1 ubiquitin-protein ligase (E3) [Yamadazyma tenuis]